MGRKTRKCSQNCLRHHFSLKPVHYSAFFSREIEFSFCPEKCDDQSKIPIFNVDRKPYTSAFILASQQLKMQSQDDLYRLEHERIKRQNYQQKSQIFIPKPRSKGSYCSVCKDLFDDYQQHIESMTHKQAVKSSSFEEDILKLCRTVKVVDQKPSSMPNSQELQFLSEKNESSSYFCQNLNKEIAMEQCQDQAKFWGQKDTKELYQGFVLSKSIRSFHSYNSTIDKIDKNVQGDIKECVLGQGGQKNQVQDFGTILNVEQTASPLKSRFQRSIILTAGAFKVDQ